MVTAKNPTRPPHPLTKLPGDVTTYSEPLWRIHRTQGVYSIRWDEPRRFGPIKAMRWEPHPPSPAPSTTLVSVLYAATDVPTAFAEVFQEHRKIVASDSRSLTGWTPARELELLDLTQTEVDDKVSWLVRNHASTSLTGARKTTCSNWAAAIHSTWPELDGIKVPSTMTGQPMVVLFSPSSDLFPRYPTLSRRLSDVTVAGTIKSAAEKLQWSHH